MGENELQSRLERVEQKLDQLINMALRSPLTPAPADVWWKCVCGCPHSSERDDCGCCGEPRPA